jgi:hydrogenase maturation protease
MYLLRHTFFENRLAARMTSNVIVIGVGNSFRGDDGVGLMVARLLKEQSPTHIRVVEQSRQAFALLELWDKTDTVIIIDAVVSGAQPGTVHRFDVQAGPIPTAWFHGSTHAFGVAEAIELARALGQLPPRVLVFGIEARHWEAGVGLSPELERVVPTLVERILQEVRCTNCP